MNTRMALPCSVLLLTSLIMTEPAQGADPATGQAMVLKNASERQHKAASPAVRASAKTAQNLPARSASTYEAEIATISAQADAAETACTSQPSVASRQICRDAVKADRARATQSVNPKHAVRQPGR